MRGWRAGPKETGGPKAPRTVRHRTCEHAHDDTVGMKKAPCIGRWALVRLWFAGRQSRLPILRRRNNSRQSLT